MPCAVPDKKSNTYKIAQAILKKAPQQKAPVKPVVNSPIAQLPNSGSMGNVIG